MNVSMAAIANIVGRQFGENAQSWFANGTTKTVSIYDENVFSFLPTEYSSQQPMYGDASRLNGSLPDTIQLPTIVSSASNSEDIDDFEGMHLEIEKEAPRDLNIAYALGGVNSAYNISAALARIEQKAMLQREADIAAAYNQRTWAERAESAKYSGGFFDTFKYVGQQTLLKVGDAASFGLLSRSDQRLLQVRQGQLSLSTMRNANMTEAGVGGAVTLATGGAFNTIRAVGGAALARIGVGKTAQYYGGLAAAGAGSGILMDGGVQTSERISFGMSDGLTGRSEYDFGQIALSGGIGGIAAPALGGVAAFAGSKYNVNLQSPLYFDTNAGRLNSGIPFKVRTPIGSNNTNNSSTFPIIDGMATPLDPNAYSVIYETKIGSNVLAKRSRAEHFKKANENLLSDVNSDKDYNDLIESLVPGFRRIEGKKVPALGISPSTYTTWHHLPQSDKLQLVWRYQHEQGKGKPYNALWQELFHPDNRGGYTDGK